jgi:hypothetical protein
MSKTSKPKKIRLAELAHARSGDKGNHANIGVIARDLESFELLNRFLTAEIVACYFAKLKPERVERFVLPGISAFNFLLYDALGGETGGGASQSLRVDSQGKTLALDLLELELLVE